MGERVDEFLAEYGEAAADVIARELAGALAARDTVDARCWLELQAALAERHTRH